MTPEQELASKYGIVVRTTKAGRRVLMAWSEQLGGGMVECGVALNSPAYPLAKLALNTGTAERGRQ